MIVSCMDLNNAESNIPLENVGNNDDNSDSDEIEDEEEEEEEYTSLNNTIVPEYSNFNQNIIWENVFTEGTPGKVNRAVVDSNGDAAVVFMPDNQTRVLKINNCPVDFARSSFCKNILPNNILFKIRIFRNKCIV